MAKNPFSSKKTDETPEPTQGELPVAVNETSEQSTSNLPKEVQDYYDSGRRERRGMAWLLGFGTLLVTLLLAAGIFFGGRWIYRQFVSNDDGQTQDTAQIGENQQNESNQNSNNPSNNQNNPNSQNQDQPAQSQPAPQPSTPPTPVPAPQPAPTAPTATPNTGPGDVVAIAAATAVVSTAGFYVVQLRRED